MKKAIVFRFVTIVGLLAAVCQGQTLVQQPTCSNAFTNSLPCTIAAPGAGHLLTAQIAHTDNSITVSGVSGGGVTWTQAAHSGTRCNADIWFGANSSGSGTTVTVSYSGLTGVQATVSEWSGMATSSAQDSIGAANTGGNTSPTTASLATGNAADLLIAVLCNTGGSTISSGPTNSFTALNTATNTIQINAYRVVSSTGSYSTSWVYNATAFWDTAIAAFKAKPTSGGCITLLGVGSC